MRVQRDRDGAPVAFDSQGRPVVYQDHTGSLHCWECASTFPKKVKITMELNGREFVECQSCFELQYGDPSLELDI